VQTEATQCAQASGQPADLLVPVHRLPPFAAGRLALGIEAVGQVGQHLLQALRDGREVLLVAADQRGVGLVGEVVGKVEHAGQQWTHVITHFATPISAGPGLGRRFCGTPRVLPQDPRCAIR
jgi:hypothetical protein